MVIRKITIRNITSFKGEQTIDFTAEPLRSAGLFAITGDTGAGKSTILDAVCLALYNRAPRFDDREQLKYITGQSPDTDIELRGSDTRNALRRGETDGMCCVEFSTAEGVFRATWQLRIKRTGRYARPEQTLEQIAPNHRTINPQDFAGEVKRIVGLDYEQFTRTVILAQNSFANFLRAHQNDKSALLEKITGTEIYALISKEVYRLNQEAQKAYEVKCSELKGLTAGYLDEADLARLENERHLRESSAQAIDQKLEYLKKQIDWYDKYEKLSDEVRKATESFDEANRHFIDLRDMREKLARYDEVAAVKDKFLLLKDVENLKTVGKSEAESYREQEKTKERIFAVAAKEYEEAQNSFRKADSQYEQQRPLLKKGHDLKRDVLYDKNSINERQSKIKATESQAAARKKELEARQHELAAIEKQEQICEGTLQELSVHQKMLDQSAAIIEKLKRYSATQGKSVHLNAEQQAIQRSLENLRKEFAAMESELNLLSQKQKSLVEQRNLCKARNSEFEGGLLQKNYDAAFAMQEKLRGARKLWKNISDGYSGIEDLEELRSRTSTTLSYLANDISAKEKQIKQLHETYDNRLKAYTLSQSEDIKGLRQGLKEGAPCPVCGATHHPYHTETEQHLGELLTMIEKEFREVEAQLNKQTDEFNALKQKQSADEVRLNSIDEQIRKLKAQLAVDTEEWGEYASLDPSFANCSQNVNRPARHVMLAQIADNADRTVNSAKARLDEFNKNRNTIEALTAGIEQLAGRADDLQRRRSNLLRSIGQAESQLDKANKEIKENNASVNELYSDLENLVTISNWHTLVRDNAEEFVGKIIAMTANRQRNLEQLQKLKGMRAETEHDIKTLAAMLEELERNAQKLKEEIEMLDASINDKQNAISEMFGREDPDDVEHRMEAAVKIARDNMERKDKLLQENRNALHDISQMRGSAEQNVAKQEKRAAALRDDIDRWIFSFNNTHSPVQFNELERIFKDTCNWNELRDKVDKAKTARILAEDRMNFAQRQLNSLLTLPQRPDRATESRVTIENSITRMNAQKDEVSRLLAETASRLRAHEESKAKIAQFEPELKALEAKRTDWGKLNALIGSADGNLFRVQAQCFTLKLLVEHANVQLSNLSPRYRLQCIPDSLGLEIIDRYMCDQKRPVSSLSGGETFVVSLGLALGLASLSSSNLAIGSLFIDEGFGNLDNESLAMVIKALGNLQSAQGRKVGIISHTSQIRDSIHPQLQVLKQKSEGYSYIRISGI